MQNQMGLRHYWAHIKHLNSTERACCRVLGLSVDLLGKLNLKQFREFQWGIHLSLLRA